jgi:Ser-tRNA(Ala) deacylase AlaX
MDDASSRPSLPHEGHPEGRSYIVMRSALLHNRVFSLGEVREMPDFGHHFTRLHECGHVRCIDSFCLGAE